MGEHLPLKLLQKMSYRNAARQSFQPLNSVLLLLLQLNTDEDGAWTVWVMGGDRASGRLANTVLLVIYGDNGKSGELRLADGQLCNDQRPANEFETRLFHVACDGDVGGVYKVRVGIPTNDDDALHSDRELIIIQMKLLNTKTEEQYTFVPTGDTIISWKRCEWLEIPIHQTTPNDMLSVLTYRVEVYTGYLPEAGTDAKVHLMLIGERGDTGYRQLLKPISADLSRPFQPGQRDVFEVNAVDLMNVTRVIVRHNEKEEGRGWLLQKVRVCVADTEADSAHSYWTFPCDRWFDSGEDDGRIEREIDVAHYVQTPPPPPCDSGEDDKLIERELDVVHHAQSLPPQPHEEPIEEDEQDVWIVSITTGTYEPPGKNEDIDEDAVNTNNNANDKEDNKASNYISQKKKSLKYHVAPWAPIGDLLIVIYGHRGKTGLLPLISEQADDNEKFLPGSVDKFKVRFSEDIGEIYKVRLSFDDDVDAEQNWLLDTVVLESPKDGCQYTFELKDRMIRDKELDGQTEIPLKPAADNQLRKRDDSETDGRTDELEKLTSEMLQVLTYRVEVYTGYLPEAGTDAKVHLMLIGERGDTGYRQLLKPISADLSRPFQSGQVDVFEVVAVDLMNVTRVIVGHNEKKEGRGWLLRKVRVCVADAEADSAHSFWTFPCDEWFDSGKVDGLIERELNVVYYVQTPPPQFQEPMEKEQQGLPEDYWKVLIISGTYFGEPQPKVIAAAAAEEDADENDTNSKQANEKEAERNDACQQNDGENNGENTNNNADSDSEDDKFSKKRSKSSKYFVTPQPPTSQLFLEIYGDLGKTGLLPLTAENPEMISFEAGQADEFQVRFPENLGEIYKMRIGFASNTKQEENWMLDAVILHNPRTGHQYVFELKDRLIRDEEFDGWKEIPLTQDNLCVWSAADTCLSVYTYEVEVFTGVESNTEMNANVHITLLGERGDTGRRRLLKPITYTSDQKFRPEQKDVFELEAVDLLDVKKVVVGHDAVIAGEGWFLDRIIVHVNVPQCVKRYVFPCNRWLDVQEDDGCTERELDVCAGLWKVEVVTGKPQSTIDSEQQATAATGDSQKETNIIAGDESNTQEKPGSEDENRDKTDDTKTEAEQPLKSKNDCDGDENTDHNAENWNENEKQVKATQRDVPFPPTCRPVIVLYGDQGKTQPLYLGDNQSLTEIKFQPGIVDKFSVNTYDDPGKIYKVRVGFADDSDEDQKWLLNKMRVEDMLTDNAYTFETQEELVRNSESDGWKEIPVKVGALTNDQTTDDGQQPAHRDVSDDAEDKDTSAAGDAAAELIQSQQSEPQLSVYTYVVEVYTGEQEQAGTDANVHLMLVGHRGDTGSRKLLKSLGFADKKFQPGQVDFFAVDAVDLDDVESIIVGHDNTQPGSGWFLDKVVVYSPYARGLKMFTFHCNRWLDTSEDDGLIERQLDVIAQDGDWLVSVMTLQAESGGLHSQVTLSVFAADGRSVNTALGHPGVGLFRSGACDQFTMNIDSDITKNISKIRIEHDGRIPGKGWHLDKIVLEKTCASSEVDLLDFSVERWMSVDLDDGDLVREVAAPQLTPAYHKLSATRYMVQVETGDTNDFEPITDVYIVLYGERGDSGLRYLSKSKEGGQLFELLKTDTFHLEAIGLGELQKILIGYDSGPKWSLDQVTIRESDDAAEEYVFTRPASDVEWRHLELTGIKQPVQVEVDNSDAEPSPANKSLTK